MSNVFVFQVKEILQQRIREEAASQQLSISVYDTERNEKAKLHRKELVGVVQLGFLLALETAGRLHDEAFSPIPGRVMFTYFKGFLRNYPVETYETSTKATSCRYP